MRKKVEIMGLSHAEHQVGSYIIVLSEKDGNRKVPVLIRMQDAQTIAIKIEKMKSPRPLTHDLFKSLCEAFDIYCREVVIYKVLEGIFYSQLVVNNGSDEMYIECMVGDAIALSLEFSCPLYVTEEVFAVCGVVIDDEGIVIETAKSKKNVISVEDLEKMREQAILEENYELAAEIRDKINNITSK